MTESKNTKRASNHPVRHAEIISPFLNRFKQSSRRFSMNTSIVTPSSEQSEPETPLNKAIKALHAASIEVSTHLLAQLPDLEGAVLQHLFHGGALLAVEVRGLPSCQSVHLFAVERETSERYPVTKVSLFEGAQQ